MMDTLRSLFADSSFVGKSLKATTSDTSFTVKEADDFSYTDPIDGSVSKKQGLYVKFEDGSRIVFRLSGTGSSGATVRLYVEKYSKDESEYARDTQEGLKPLIEVALSMSKLEEFTGRKEPTVITVSLLFLYVWCLLLVQKSEADLLSICVLPVAAAVAAAASN
jgi:phosphoglucomutase